MSNTIIDLDKLTPKTFTIRLGGADYVLPQSAPLDEALEMFALYDRLGNPADDKLPVEELKGLFEKIGNFMSKSYPDCTAEWLRQHLSLQQGAMLLREISGQLLSMAPPDDDPS